MPRIVAKPDAAAGVSKKALGGGVPWLVARPAVSTMAGAKEAAPFDCDSAAPAVADADEPAGTAAKPAAPDDGQDEEEAVAGMAEHATAAWRSAAGPGRLGVCGTEGAACAAAART